MLHGKAKQDMKNMPPMETGSWKHAVTCRDGVWRILLISMNSTATLRNYSLLYYMYTHKCMRGSPGDDDIFLRKVQRVLRALPFKKYFNNLL